MDLEEIKGRVDRLGEMFAALPYEAHVRGRLVNFHRPYLEILEIRRLLDEPIEAVLDPEEGVVCISLARFDELRQAEEDLQDVRVATGEEDEPLHPPLAMSHMRDMQKQIEVLAGRIDGLYARAKERADANRDFAAGVGARFKDQGERIARHHERAEEFDRRLRSFGARLAEVEATRPDARDEGSKEKDALRRELEELKRDLSPGRIVRDGPIPPMGGARVHPDGKVEVR